MSRFVHAALAALILMLPASAQERIVRTIREARNLAHDDFTTPLDFELSGRLVYFEKWLDVPSDRMRMVVIEHGGDRLMLHISKEHPFNIQARPGDLVALRGQTEINHGIYKWLRIDDAEVLSHGEASDPERATIGGILDGRHDLKVVTVRGEMSAVFKDEIDARWYYCILRDGERKLHLAVCDDSINHAWTHKTVGAEVEATGLCITFYGLRKFLRSGVRITCPDSLRIVCPATDPFNVPLLESDRGATSGDDVMRIGRRKVCGLVLAAWGENRILVKSADGRIARVDLAVESNLPKAGDMVCAAGTVSTDFFRLNLMDAVVRSLPQGTPPVAPEATVSENRLISDMARPMNKVLYLGKTVRVSGRVERVMQTGDASVRIDLDVSGTRMTAVADTRLVPLDEVEAGCKAEVTGAFVTDGDNWRPDTPFPRIGEWFIALRSPGDIRVLSRPPWWTTGRLSAIIALLLATLAGFAAWNRALRLLANKRGRELYREQIAHVSAQLRVDERTRLAAELHDSLSQNLSGIACQVSTAKLTAGDDETRKLLTTAERMLQSSRTELTRCIGDLRCDTLEEPDFDAAIRKNLAKLALPASVLVRFNIPRAKVSDSTAHSILCIVRELVSNAVRHGKASSIDVVGSIENDRLSFSVKDNGCGFDADNRPGVNEGHFGLEGIKDRVNRLGGSLEIKSAPGKGAEITVVIAGNAS